jgi:site-specific recombinase XerD
MYGLNKMTLRGVRKCKLKHIHEVKLMWKKIKKEAGVENRDLKSLRHTFATYCVTIGIPLRTIQKYLMHKSIKTTEIYAAVSEDAIIIGNEKLTAGFNALIQAA